MDAKFIGSPGVLLIVLIFLVGFTGAGIYIFAENAQDDIGVRQRWYQKLLTEEDAVGSAVLEAVGEFQGSGTTLRGVFDGIFAFMAEAELADPDDDSFYETWLAKPETDEGGFADVISTGRMERADEGRYLVVYDSPLREEQDKNLLEYTTVIISLESKVLGHDGVPEQTVLSGQWQPKNN